MTLPRAIYMARVAPPCVDPRPECPLCLRSLHMTDAGSVCLAGCEIVPGAGEFVAPDAEPIEWPLDAADYLGPRHEAGVRHSIASGWQGEDAGAAAASSNQNGGAA